MLREFRVNCADAPAADFKAEVELKTGMGVVKDYAKKTLKLPTAATDKNIFVVQKVPVPEGVEASRVNFSDYEDAFNTVAAGEGAVAYSYRPDSAFGTDQFDASTVKTENAGKCVNVGTDGKWVVSSTDTKYIFTGMYNDAGHVLARIEVVEAPAAAASSTGD